MSSEKREVRPPVFDKAGRCPQCRLPVPVCFCAQMPRLDLGTRVHFFVHRREFFLASNTVHLATRVLNNSTYTVHGDPQIDSMAWPAPTPPAFVLFPSEDAVPLTAQQGPITLVVPDGSWRQSKKMVRRIPAMVDLPHVFVPEQHTESIGPRLRERPREGWVSTIEAVAGALGILEGAEAQQTLQAVYREFALRLRPERYRHAGFY